MITREVEICNKIGLCAGPASLFVNEACSFKSNIWVERGSTRVSGQSLMGLLHMQIRKGEKVTLIADGADEAAAIDGLVALLYDKLEK